MKYREIVYMVLDEIKAVSDDSFFTEDHIIFLLGKYRAFILKQRYSDVKKQIPNSNYQTICLDLMEVPAIAGESCIGGTYLKSTTKIPTLMGLGNTRVYPAYYYDGDISLISRERMKYVGYNKYMKNIIYASIGVDNYLYLKSFNPQYLYLEKLKLTGIFEDPKLSAELQCENEETTCDILDTDFPLEEALIPAIIELIVKELLGASYRPEDKVNNANDDLPNIVTRSTSRSNSQK